MQNLLKVLRSLGLYFVLLPTLIILGLIDLLYLSGFVMQGIEDQMRLSFFAVVTILGAIYLFNEKDRMLLIISIASIIPLLSVLGIAEVKLDYITHYNSESIKVNRSIFFQSTSFYLCLALIFLRRRHSKKSKQVRVFHSPFCVFYIVPYMMLLTVALDRVIASLIPG
ncbi:hypothetical protein ACFL2B_02810 [Patescibacteria group bacterium]